jgi:hypothetical protein
MTNATDTEDYIRNAIRLWVWSGYYDEDLVNEMLDDILEDDVDESAMRAAIPAEFAKKTAAERSWPKETDCDRLDRVFARLDAEGICAVQNAGYTMSDGYSDVAEAVAERGRTYHGYVFFHGQDVERAIDGHGLTLAFGNIDDDPAKTVAIGKAVSAALAAADFATDWDGTADTRIDLPRIDWKRRY